MSLIFRVWERRVRPAVAAAMGGVGGEGGREGKMDLRFPRLFVELVCLSVVVECECNKMVNNEYGSEIPALLPNGFEFCDVLSPL